MDLTWPLLTVTVDRQKPPSVMQRHRAIISALLLALLAGCHKAGEGPRAARGYARATPVIAALDSFFAVHGRYPDSLPQLVPTYLPGRALAVPQDPHERFPLEYTGARTDFTLEFRYTGQFVSQCSFTASAHTWSCVGYY